MRNALLIPFSWLYALVLKIRHGLFDKHLLPSHRVDIPTICVGNIAVGGTGKTPMTAYIVHLLQTHGYHPAILSRGYKRKTRGFVMADANATVDSIGDEMMQLHQAFPDIPKAVCESRVYGIRQLVRHVPGLDVIVLDDAMQHRALRCGLTILLTPYDRLYIDDHLLPWGTLRDLPSRALAADMVVVTKCPDTMQPIDMRVIDNKLHLPTFQHLHFTGISYAPIKQQGTPLVLCGIAQPHYLMDYLLRLYPHAELLAFPDHHRYTAKDIETIVEKARHFDFVLTTEKDMQRLQTTDLIQQLTTNDKQLIALPIRTRFFTPQEQFDKQIVDFVRENRNKSPMTNHQ